MAFLSEAKIEHVLLEQLRGPGYAIAADEAIGPDGAAPERDRPLIPGKCLGFMLLRLK
jgi:type I restriction enzyme R subunit